MKLHAIPPRAGLLVTLATGSTLASAAGESAASSGLSDNFIVLGLAAALVIFAFTRKPETQAPSASPVSEPPAETASPVEAEQPVEEAATEKSGTEESGSAEAPSESGETPPPGAA